MLLTGKSILVVQTANKMPIIWHFFVKQNSCGRLFHYFCGEQTDVIPLRHCNFLLFNNLNYSISTLRL